jgi:hypothetical protein
VWQYFSVKLELCRHLQLPGCSTSSLHVFPARFTAHIATNLPCLAAAVYNDAQLWVGGGWRGGGSRGGGARGGVNGSNTWAGAPMGVVVSCQVLLGT